MPGGFLGKAVLTLGGTAAGVAALLSFKTHSPASAAPAVSAPGTQAAAPAGTTAPGSAAAATASGIRPTTAVTAGTAAGQPAGGEPAASATASSGAATQTRSITGTAENTPYGPMQVKVTLEGQRITAVTVVQQTNDGPESQQIDSFSIPKLTSETLAAQSARIDSVSGATWTSTGYIQSLQSALDQA